MRPYNHPAHLLSMRLRDEAAVLEKRNEYSLASVKYSRAAIAELKAAMAVPIGLPKWHKRLIDSVDSLTSKAMEMIKIDSNGLAK